jgi:hypothetical protein
MEEYVELVAPPFPNNGLSQAAYEVRYKEKMFYAYEKMKWGMLLVEVFEKIWTIQMYRKK